MPPLRLAKTGPSPVSCDCCHRAIPPGDPLASLKVTGPADRATARPVGDYCGRCWHILSAAWDVLEELGRPRPGQPA